VPGEGQVCRSSPAGKTQLPGAPSPDFQCPPSPKDGTIDSPARQCRVSIRFADRVPQGRHNCRVPHVRIFSSPRSPKDATINSPARQCRVSIRFADRVPQGRHNCQVPHVRIFGHGISPHRPAWSEKGFSHATRDRSSTTRTGLRPWRWMTAPYCRRLERRRSRSERAALQPPESRQPESEALNPELCALSSCPRSQPPNPNPPRNSLIRKQHRAGPHWPNISVKQLK